MEDRKKICKAVHQYNSAPLDREDMDRLLEIARDCMVVRNHVYQRYGGIGSLGKLYPGYTVQNEMTASGLREKLELPTVYFYPAVFNALRDIKTQWTQVKGNIYSAINKNERFTPADKHYLRFAVKVDGCFENILKGKPIRIPTEMEAQYESILAELQGDGEERRRNLNRYLCRQVRKKLHKLHTEKFLYFSVAERGYRYGTEKCGDGTERQGIFLTTKARRKRLFVPLTDTNAYSGMLDIRLKPEQDGLEIVASVFIRIRKHIDYINEIGISLGLWNMITTSTGHTYGSQFGEMQKAVFECAASEARRKKLVAALKNYVNREINRMFAEEKPGKIYMVKLPRNPSVSGTGQNGYLLRLWRKGYVTERLEWKSRQNSVEIVEVLGKGIGGECSACGAETAPDKGRDKDRYGGFRCPVCGYEEDRKVNTARNALNRGRSGKQLNKVFPAEEFSC
ncbi:MAG: transposase [bacterium]|nr:transposase [bacterium]MCM1423626.1 transposase [bacterium]